MTQPGHTAEGRTGVGAGLGTGPGKGKGHRPAEQLQTLQCPKGPAQVKLGDVPGPDLRMYIPRNSLAHPLVKASLSRSIFPEGTEKKKIFFFFHKNSTLKNNLTCK